ncbi:MAG TPA: bifunctional [glutamine synthetase] adenylyltransferase/[glutamine synthetase]-adenylyl-L-tyrosine phosphorylase [Mycobacteriales bacterium]|nr:bifunctional [glutamine synthetase] adenylyltransferase/[glutamine synthetase]-adenylyl-L-tyrosine phosphorylase [Mycobacteriales bacterium]
MRQSDRTASTGGRLARLGFNDPDGAQRRLIELGLSSHDEVIEELGQAADPDRALSVLERIAAAGNRDELLAQVSAFAGLRRRLVAVAGASAALGDWLVRHPQQWRQLVDDDAAAARPTRFGLQVALQREIEGRDGREAYDALRVGYRSAVLGLAARDLCAGLAVDDVAAELADLAEATLGAALRVAEREYPDRSSRLAVIAMGKCGGRELNYVSDVDVVFVAEPADAAPAATTLASTMMRVCSDTTSEGSIWPVDAALRPEGKAGPLVRTLASHVGYYERWAKTWEFQALLKARAVAGDAALGAEYVAAVAPMVWAAAGRPSFVEDVQAMRRRVVGLLSAAEAPRQVKLGPGGLRDVEFAVQLLQLVHGRGDESLRSPTTLVALAALAQGGYVGRDDAAVLAAAYRFLRTVEHRLQLQHLRRTHLLPADEAGLRWLARSMGHRDVASWHAEYDGHIREVRRIHEKLFYRPLLNAVARLPSEGTRLTTQAATARLEALGFSDPTAALRHIEALTAGVSRNAAILRALLPAMLGWFADAADPDAGLLSFRQVSDALGSTPWYLRVLRDEGATAERLARLLATSRFVADLLGRAPETVALLADDDELQPRGAEALRRELVASASRNEKPEEAVVAVRALRRKELLRIAFGDLLGLIDVGAVGRALTDAAGATLAAALESAQRKVRADLGEELPVRLAVIGMGRLGGLEQGYGSDADVLFVYEPVGADAPACTSAAHEIAQELRRLLSMPAPDPPLVVDADLRPEGRQGPLVRSLASYAEYYERWSAPWEMQALLRAHPIAGDADLALRFIAMIDPMRYPRGGVSDAEVREIRRLKARMEAERLPRGVDPSAHLKLGRGGLSDVEWTVQLLQLRHGADRPELRTTATLEALRAAVAADLLSDADARALEDAWVIATRVRNAIVLARGRASDVLPSDARTLAAVARAMGYPAGHSGDLLEDYRRATRRARSVHERVFAA